MQGLSNTLSIKGEYKMDKNGLAIPWLEWQTGIETLEEQNMSGSYSYVIVEVGKKGHRKPSDNPVTMILKCFSYSLSEM